jgi:hypothetical protein
VNQQVLSNLDRIIIALEAEQPDTTALDTEAADAS